ncbi:MAG: OmpA family protein [Caedimonas sp.]|jgi:outer membrane protein OmpA-like peptidoglycan-associated protein|nr:OmpA family protein [Caedimonas sp.]
MSENKPANSMLKIGALAAALLTANCASYEIDQLEKAPREGYEFSRELANQYQSLAQREDAKFDESDASYFAVKGLQAAAGQEVLPEDPRKWDVPDHALEDLMDMRHHLIFSLAKSGERVAPKQAAAAQVGFDCMVSQLRECQSCGENDLAMCRDMFEKNLTAVEKAVEKVAPTFTLHFAEDKWDLTPDAMHTLREVAKVAANMNKTTLNVTGHTDAKGGRKHNLILSQKRAMTVAHELVRLGVDSRRITPVGAGEIEGPEVMPKHRKVTIHIH